MFYEFGKDVPKYYSQMDRNALSGYCSIHCKTSRALFSKEMIAQMVEYAGSPEHFSKSEEGIDGIKWYSMHEEMEELVKLARENSK